MGQSPSVQVSLQVADSSQFSGWERNYLDKELDARSGRFPNAAQPDYGRGIDTNVMRYQVMKWIEWERQQSGSGEQECINAVQRASEALVERPDMDVARLRNIYITGQCMWCRCECIDKAFAEGKTSRPSIETLIKSTCAVCLRNTNQESRRERSRALELLRTFYDDVGVDYHTVVRLLAYEDDIMVGIWARCKDLQEFKDLVEQYLRTRRAKGCIRSSDSKWHAA